MTISEEILSGKQCPYCLGPSEYVDSKLIYGRHYGYLYACLPCKAWVGVHKNNPTVALGRLANQSLRNLKKEAHAIFDPIWQIPVLAGKRKDEARTAAYLWLSEQMGTPVEYTHIGMYDEEQCKQVIKICEDYYEQKRNENKAIDRGNHETP